MTKEGRARREHPPRASFPWSLPLSPNIQPKEGSSGTRVTDAGGRAEGPGEEQRDEPWDDHPRRVITAFHRELPSYLPSRDVVIRSVCSCLLRYVRSRDGMGTRWKGLRA